MKKLFLSMLAAVTLFASCSEDEVVTQSNEENSTMTFNVSTSEIASRALGDGTKAAKLYYAVYDEEGMVVENISKTTGTGVSITPSKATPVTLSLLNGETYSIIFWAESGEGMCTVDWESKKISLKDELVSNQEGYDAFYAYVAPFKVTSSKSETVKLYRPFAQMNIGTTAEDLTGLKAYYNSGDIKKSQLKVKAYKGMDLTTGEVTGDAGELTYTFADYNTDDFPIAGYQYLSMNYLLVNNEKELMDVTLELSDEGTKAVASKTFTNVPVQRNYRTNIFGQLFTSQTNWSVELLPEFESSYTVLSGHVTLTEDLTIDKPMVVNSGDVVLDLNGHSIKSTFEYNENDPHTSAAIAVLGGTLTIKGEGSIENENMYGVHVRNAATLNIEGGTFKGQTTAVNITTGTVNISGGHFSAKPYNNDYRYTLNCIDANFKNKTAVFNVTGGTFENFNPANNLAEGANTNFVADGYTSVQDGDSWTVAKAVATADELTAALAEGGEVALTASVNLETSLIVAAGKSVTINLNGNNITNTSTSENFGEAEGIIAYGELTIEGTGTVQANSMAVWARGTEGAKITINGGTYKGLSSELAKGGRGVIYASSGNTINIYGGTFEAMAADKTSFADKTNGVYAALNIADNNGNITVYGGSFKNFNPAAPGTEPKAWNETHTNGFVADGYTSTQDEEYWVVSKQ